MTIQARKERLTRLHVQLQKAEDAIFQEFNLINKNPEYATPCTDVEHTGSHITEHVCTPQFVDTANEAYAKWLIGLWGQPEDPYSVIVTKMPAYRAKVIELTLKNKKLNKLASDYDALNKEYQAVEKEKFKRHGYVFD